MKPASYLLCALLAALPATAAFGRPATEPQPTKRAAAGGEQATSPEGEPASGAAPSDTFDFDFFAPPPGTDSGQGATAGDRLALDQPDLASQVKTRRLLLTAHQTLGITTWALMAATTVIGQLHYRELYGGGGGTLKYKTTHRWLALSTGVAFAATGTLAVLAPTPYDRPLRFDTGLIHRIAAAGATAGMVTQIVLGWVTARRAEAGNPNSPSYARAHQVVGYTTLGFLTVAGLVWVF